MLPPSYPLGEAGSTRMDANPDTWREGMKNWREFKIFGVRVMDTRNGRTHLREPWKWPFVGALICWPIAR